MDFKKRNDEMIKEREELWTRWNHSERALALKSPVMEAEYAFDQRTALSLYDCLIPTLREQRRLWVQRDYKLTIADMRA